MLAEEPCGSAMNQTVFGNVNGTTKDEHSTDYKRGLKVDYGTQRKKRHDGGYGSCWDGSITNPTNPQVRCCSVCRIWTTADHSQRRDVNMLLPEHYIVVQWSK